MKTISHSRQTSAVILVASFVGRKLTRIDRGRYQTLWDEVIVTAKGASADFVSRMFAPRIGIPEDPVTGAIHCSLIPFWAERLGKTELFARQISARGGELFCGLKGERVNIGGNASL